MTKNENQRLCGGTFFTLLLQARKPRNGVREHFKGQSDGFSETNTLIGLIKVVVPDYTEPTRSMKGTFKEVTFNYKACNISKSVYLPFVDPAVVSAFDTRVKTEYNKALAAMSDFVADFIVFGTSTKKDECLVKALLELIDADDTIDDTQVFYMNENGTTTTKADLRDLSEISLQPFLLGIWHFIVINRKDNTIGKETYNAWCPSRGGATREYKATLGCTIKRQIKVSSCAEIIEEDNWSGVSNNDSSEEFDDKYSEPEPEETFTNTTNQIVNNPIVFNQYGNNNIQVGNIETLTINNK
jgi:hypothetical protein